MKALYRRNYLGSANEQEQVNRKYRNGYQSF